MDLDPSAVSRWIAPLGLRPGEIAEVFVERRRETHLFFRDGEVTEARVGLSAGVSARRRLGREERLAFVSRADEGGAHEAVRALSEMVGLSPLPAKPARGRAAEEEEDSSAPVERWRRRLAAALARHAPRHRFRWTLREVTRQVIPAGAPASSFSRRLISLEGEFTAASRRGDEPRGFSFHAPDSEATADELKTALALAAVPRERPTPCAGGETDVVLAGGSAAVLFHEILSHPLESEAPLLSRWKETRLSVSDLEVKDDPTRLDLFGGYERDDEGTRPRAVKLLDAGRLAGSPGDRFRAGGGASNGHARRAEASDPPLVRGSNLLVAAGQATGEEMARRLSDGLWIEEIAGGSVELSSGQFRLRFPRARRVRRGKMAEETGAGIVLGETIPALRGVESGMGRDVRVCRSLGWCARAGQVVPVQGAAPDVLIRKLLVRSST